MPEDIGARFERDTANHEMTVLHDDGLYRHLRFRDPSSGFYWFDLVTWPGFLAFTGDMDGYVFTRVEDMFAFFRGHKVKPGYWSEKVVDGRDRLKRYDEDVLEARVKEILAEYEKAHPGLATEYELDKADFDALPRERRYPYDVTGKREPVEPKTPDDLRAMVEGYNADGALSYESGARELLRELEDARVVADTWEWDLQTWDWQFLWACHAIVWGIGQYDAARADLPAEAVTSSV